MGAAAVLGGVALAAGLTTLSSPCRSQAPLGNASREAPLRIGPAPVGDCIPDRNNPPAAPCRPLAVITVVITVVIPEFSSRAGAMLNVRNECNRAG